jgi:ribonuclease HI
VEWSPISTILGQAIAAFLEEDEATVVVSPHPWLTKMSPLWVGRRRWAQTRKQYKKIINKRQEDARREARSKLEAGLRVDHDRFAKAVHGLEWGKIYRMEGVTAYQTQNIFKLKVNRLRLWADNERGFQCLAEQCGDRAVGGTAHLAWGCPEAQMFWTELRERWGMTDQEEAGNQERGIAESFGFRLDRMPQWLVEWGRGTELTQWEDLQHPADAMWAVGVAVMLTAIWRRNADQVHPEEREERGLVEAVKEAGAAVSEAYARYRMGLLPWTKDTAVRLQIADVIARQCKQMDASAKESSRDRCVRVGFFDGGSRGNHGPGGSGSVVVQLAEDQTTAKPIWAAVTVLGSREMTNNVAEFVGLRRMLAYAAVKGWREIHVVGDSAMILRLMRTRRPPKSKRLKHWYQESMRLADICRVVSWTHHYRTHNKMADWLANQAMDGHKSVMMASTEEMRGTSSSRVWRHG